MRLSRTDLLSLLFVILSFAMVGLFYDRLPDPVPTHWNTHGVANGFMAKPWGALIVSLAMILASGIFWVIPRISPRGYGVDQSIRAYAIIQASALAFLFVVNALALMAAAGMAVSIARTIPVALGALFMVLGNFMGKFRKNFFVGLRTPWTLASDQVWLRTHRLGGRLFAAAGLLLVAAGLLGGLAILAVIPVLLVLTGVVPIVYSFVTYRRLESGRPSGQPR
jgi:uncharacterized membrane protein